MQIVTQWFKPKIQKPESEKPTEQHWGLLEEGQLLIDMYERPDAVVVRSFVAGVNPDDLEISMYNDLLTIRGSRSEHEEIHDDRYYHRECYWGTFSRSIVIPVPIDPELIRAYFKNGVVTIELPKLIEEDPSLRIEPIDLENP